MAQVVQQPIEQTTTPISNFLGDIFGMVPLLIFGIAFICVCIIVFLLIRRLQDERKAMTDPLYSNWKNTMASAINQADDKRIRNYYSLMNILWLGIPFKRNEFSAKILNYRDELLGYYRGHLYSQDMNSLNLVLYKTKSFGIIEDKFILKCPRLIPVIIKDSKGNKKKDTIDFSSYITELSTGDYKIYCPSIEKFSYFWIPNYMYKNQEVYDMRSVLNENIVDIGHSEMVTKVMSIGSGQVEKAMSYNPRVKYQQMTPKKTKQEDEEVEE